MASNKSADYEKDSKHTGKEQIKQRIHHNSFDIGHKGMIINPNVTVEGQNVKKISFLKVPKSGSSTVACIFIRFGINNNLSMFLPKQSQISQKDQKLLLEKEKHYDIFIIHTHYNYNFFTNIVRNPAIIGLVRRPETRLISHAFFFGLYKKHESFQGLSHQDFINKLVANTSRYGVQNVMGKYFGLNNPNMPEDSLQEQLLKLNSEFKLVLILERLDESLIILKRLVRWSIFDILYAAKKKKNREDIHLNERQIRYLKYSNYVEYAIYDFFYHELERKIANAGDDFEQEVKQFKHILAQTSEFCNGKNNKETSYTFPASRWDDSFIISKSDCNIIFKKDVTQLKMERLTDF